jgi:BON domain
VRGARVVLEGTVPSRHMKHAIEDLVDACPGVQDIDNRVGVTNPNLRQGQSGQSQGAQSQGAQSQSAQSQSAQSQSAQSQSLTGVSASSGSSSGIGTGSGAGALGGTNTPNGTKSRS